MVEMGGGGLESKEREGLEVMVVEDGGLGTLG